MTENPPVTARGSVVTIRDVNHETDDAQIVQEILAGKSDVYAALVKRHKSFVCATVARHVPYEVVEELAHDAFVRAYRSLRNFKGQSQFRTWLRTIAVRTCYDYWRKQSRKVDIAESALAAEDRDWVARVTSGAAEETFNGEQDRKHARALLEWALSHLSAEDRMAVCLIHLEGQSVKEVAKMLDWSVVNTKVRTMRARKKLRRYIEEAISDEF